MSGAVWDDTAATLEADFSAGDAGVFGLRFMAGVDLNAVDLFCPVALTADLLSGFVVDPVPGAGFSSAFKSRVTGFFAGAECRLFCAPDCFPEEPAGFFDPPLRVAMKQPFGSV